MKVMNTLIVAMTLLFLSGCQLHQVKGEVGGVEIEAETKEHKTDDHDYDHDHQHKNKDHHKAKFCPPGQAKKGHC